MKLSHLLSGLAVFGLVGIASANDTTAPSAAPAPATSAPAPEAVDAHKHTDTTTTTATTTTKEAVPAKKGKKPAKPKSE